MFAFVSVFAILLYLSGEFALVLSNNLIKYVNINNILSTGEIIMLKSLVSIFLLLPFNGKYFIEKQTRKSIYKNIGLLLVLGLASVVSQFTWVNAIKRIPMNNAWLITMIFSPIISAVGAKIFFKENISKQIKLAFAINIFAILLINKFVVVKIDWNIGYVLLFGDLLAYTTIILLTRKLRELPSGLLVFIRFLVVLPISLVAIRHFPHLTIQIVVLTFAISALCVVGRICTTKGYKYLEVPLVQPLRYFNIVFAMIISFFVLGEKPTLYQIAGGIVIIISGIIVGLERKK